MVRVRGSTQEIWNMRLWLKSPQHIKPGALMPDFNLTDEQLDQLSAYLSTLQ